MELERKSVSMIIENAERELSGIGLDATVTFILNNSKNPQIKPFEVKHLVCEILNVDSKLFNARFRKKEMTDARKITSAFIYTLYYPFLSLEKIGQHSKADHATVLYRLGWIRETGLRDVDFRSKYELCIEALTLRYPELKRLNFYKLNG